jgi:hypothetical protein
MSRLSELAMTLRTLAYLSQRHSEMGDQLFGLPDLRKGLHTILMGYLLSLGSIMAAVGVVVYVIVQAGGSRMSPRVVSEASTVLFAAALILGLAMLGSVVLIVRGKWMCLMNAPEHCHAKWMMFLSILCVLAGPALNTAVLFVAESKEPGGSRGSNMTSAALLQKINDFEPGMPTLDARGYIKLAGKVIGMFSSLFLVLFLRAVGLCLGFSWQVRFTELYILLTVVLAAGVVVLIRDPAFMLARPQLLLGLGAGWLIAGLWYLALIFGTSIAIAQTLDLQYRR